MEKNKYWRILDRKESKDALKDDWSVHTLRIVQQAHDLRENALNFQTEVLKSEKMRLAAMDLERKIMERDLFQNMIISFNDTRSLDKRLAH